MNDHIARETTRLRRTFSDDFTTTWPLDVCFDVFESGVYDTRIVGLMATPTFEAGTLTVKFSALVRVVLATCQHERRRLTLTTSPAPRTHSPVSSPMTSAPIPMRNSAWWLFVPERGVIVVDRRR